MFSSLKGREDDNEYLLGVLWSLDDIIYTKCFSYEYIMSVVSVYMLYVAYIYYVGHIQCHGIQSVHTIHVYMKDKSYTYYTFIYVWCMQCSIDYSKSSVSSWIWYIISS